MPNEKLCWTRYEWSAISGEVQIAGQMELSYYPTRTEVCQVAINRAAIYATQNNEPWDPFNCVILVRRKRETMFKDPETGEVYE